MRKGLRGLFYFLTHSLIHSSTHNIPTTSAPSRLVLFTHLLFFSCALLLVAGCAKEPEIKYPNAITIAFGADAKRLLPMLATDSASAEISGYIFNGLTKYDKNIKITGDLAESWDIRDNGLTIIFHLRKGVRWHDGREFTSADVLFTYKTVTDPKTPTPYSSNYGPVRDVEAQDKYTVRVTYREPYAPAIESWGMGIIPRHALEGKDLASDEINRNPIGTGPYRLKERVTGQKIVLDAFDDYFEGRPNIDRIIARIIPDPATTFLELKFGGIDFSGVTPAQYKLQVYKSPFFDKYFNNFRYPSFGYTYLGFNLQHPLFSDRRIRRAIAHAINKKEIIAGVLMGFGTPCTGPFPPESWAYNKNITDIDFDPEKAAGILSSLGWRKNSQGMLEKDGKIFSFAVITNQGNESRLKAAQIIREQLRRVGIEMNIKSLEWQAMLHSFINKKRFEAVLLGWSLSRDPDLHDIWHSSKTKEGEFNFISYKNDEVDRLLVEGRQTFDIEKRKRIYMRIHEILVEDQPTIFLYVPDALTVIHKRFLGIEKAPLGITYNFIHWRVGGNRAEWYQ
jgi:peptide/nickel transport system substrate-binding protein